MPDQQDSRFDHLQKRYQDLADQAENRLIQARKDSPAIDLAATFYDRDREAFASVLGAAIALRLFLFLVPSVVTFVGLFITIFGHDQLNAVLEEASVTGSLAEQIDTATAASRTAGFAVFIGGLFLTMWAGRNLAKVLAACSGGAWGLGIKLSKASLKTAGAITALLLTMLTWSGVMNRIRSEVGIAGSTTAWLATALVIAGVWFTVSWTLPRATPDPGALLPGAAVMGVLLTGLQWFMQFYLPAKLSRSAELTGTVGYSVVTLGYMFFVGRIIASCLILNAVVYEQLGSLSQVVFELPLIRRIPVRFPSVGKFFDLHVDSELTTPPPAN